MASRGQKPTQEECGRCSIHMTDVYFSRQKLLVDLRTDWGCPLCLTCALYQPYNFCRRSRISGRSLISERIGACFDIAELQLVDGLKILSILSARRKQSWLMVGVSTRGSGIEDRPQSVSNTSPGASQVLCLAGYGAEL